LRHQRTGKKLGRDAAHRRALYANLAGALIEHGRIKTTVTKAKAVKPIAEKMITLGRRGDMHARRQATAFLRSKDVVHKLFTDVAPKLGDRPGGYARIVKLGPRSGDSAEMAYLELVDEPVVARRRGGRRAAGSAAAAVAEPVVEETAAPEESDGEVTDDVSAEEGPAAEAPEPTAEQTDSPEGESLA
jgi:large subunit ribosomal protein L17